MLTPETERRAKHHTPYGKYLARVCRVCAKEYQQARKARIAEKRKRRETPKGTKPDRRDLLMLIGRNKSWTAIGILFGVSDVTARKWAVAYGLV